MNVDVNVSEFLAGYCAGVPLGTLARRYGVTTRQVKALLIECATRLAEPEPEQDDCDDGQLRCAACRILLSEQWCTWDERGLCDDCQELLADWAYESGLDEAEVLRLWQQPIPDDGPTELERAMERKGDDERVEVNTNAVRRALLPLPA